jgi:hypothetical protein
MKRLSYGMIMSLCLRNDNAKRVANPSAILEDTAWYWRMGLYFLDFYRVANCVLIAV